jgi:hypothetical protein
VTQKLTGTLSFSFLLPEFSFSFPIFWIKTYSDTKGPGWTSSTYTGTMVSTMVSTKV